MILNGVASILCGGIGLIFAFETKDVILHITSYKFIPSAILICQFIIFITFGNKNKVFEYLGKNSLYILGTHRILLTVLQKKTSIGEWLNSYGISGDVAAIIVCSGLVVVICSFVYLFDYLKERFVKKFKRDKQLNNEQNSLWNIGQ